jgi:uncharacterized delta-60 repeat protein
VSKQRVVWAGIRVRKACAAECVGWPIQFELLERRILWSASGGSTSTLAALEAGVAYGSLADNGTVRVDGDLVEGTRTIVVQPDGNVILAAWSAPKGQSGPTLDGQSSQVSLVRLNRNGTIDASFGDDGFVRFDVPTRHWYYDALPVALQADGKILVGGDNLHRFNTDGSLDLPFGNGGQVMTESPGLVRAIAVTSSGKILTAGYNFDLQSFNADGSVDASFHRSDQSWPNGTYPHGTLQNILIQSDGKLLLVGQEVTGGGIGQALVTEQMIVRLNADGSVDTAFGAAGVVHQGAQSGTQLDGSAAALQPDGKIVITGYSSQGAIITRFNADGSLDQSFGDDGFATISDVSPMDIAVDADGKIVVVGSDGGPTASRFNSDGSLDATFAHFRQPLEGGSQFPGSSMAVAIEPDGDVLVTGQIGIENAWVNQSRAESFADFYVTRLSGGHSDPEPTDPKTNPPPPATPPPPTEPPMATPEPDPVRPLGELDESFGDDGVVITDPTGGVDRAQTVLVQPDGKTIVVGYSGTYSGIGADEDRNIETQITIVRYNVDGSLDAGFGNGGVVNAAARNPIGMRYDDAKLPAALQADGKIIVGGMALYRFNANGSVDTAFGDNGATANWGMPYVNALTILSDGKIVISTSYAFQFARYNSDGTLDTTFGGAARSTHANPSYPVTPGNVNHDPPDVLGSWRHIGEIVAQPDGKIIAVGTLRTAPFEYLVSKYYILRMNADGSLDQSFGDDGVVISEVPGWPIAAAWSAALQSDGKIVVAGGDQRGTLARYNTDGSIDTSFGDDGFIYSERYWTGADVAIQSNGKIVVSAIEGAVRYNADGSFDHAFAAPGFSMDTSSGISVAIAPDGAIVVVGQPQSLRSSQPSDFIVARFQGDPVVEAPRQPGGQPTSPTVPEAPNDGGTILPGDEDEIVVGRSGGSNDVFFSQRERISLLDDDGASNDLLGDDKKDDELLPEVRQARRNRATRKRAAEAVGRS